MGDLIQAFGIDWKLLIAQSVNFVILLVLLSYFVYGPVIRLLKDRADKIANGLKDAEAAATQLAQTATEKGVILSEAEHEATKIVARAEEKGKEERAAILKNAETRAEAVLKDAQLETAEAQRKALKNSEAEVARVAVLAAEKILRSNV